MLAEEASAMEFLSNGRTKLLICSSQADVDYLAQLQASLRTDLPAELTEVWQEARLGAENGGEAFAQTIKMAKLALLLVSPETLAPWYLTNSTTTALLETARQEGAQVLCLITRPCAFEQSTLA